MARAEKKTASGQSAAELKAQNEAHAQSVAQMERRPKEKARRVLVSQILRESQPVAWQTLEAMCSGKGVSHSILLTGPQGSLKKEMAILLAQTLLCGSTHLIQEDQCSFEDAKICEQVAEENHPDFIFIDGRRKEAISKEEGDAVQNRFADTANGKSGNKVYILNHVENTSISALNTMLKFLEEPGRNVYAILTCDNPDRILSTIVSRCAVILFNELTPSQRERLAMEEAIDPEDQYLMASSTSLTSGFADYVCTDTWQNAKHMFRQYIGVERDAREFLVDYDGLYRFKDAIRVNGVDLSAKDRNLPVLIQFFQLMIGYVHAIVLHDDSGPSWYDDAVKRAAKRNTDWGKMIRILVEERDRCNRTNDLNLLIDQAIYRMEES